MDHKTIMEYYPRFRSLVGLFVEIDDCYSAEEIIEKKEKLYFHKLIESNEIPLVYFGKDNNFHHVILCYKPVVAYITFDDSEDFYLAVRHDNDKGYELFNPWNEEVETVIVSRTRTFEDYIIAAKRRLSKDRSIKKENIFCNWEELKEFLNRK